MKKISLAQIYNYWKGKSSLTVFSSNWGYSSFILHQNSTCDNFLKMRCNVASETLSNNFPYSVRRNALSYLACWIKSFIRAYFCNIYTHLKNISSLNYVSLPKDDISLYDIIKSHTSISSERFLSIDKPSSSQWLIQVSLNSNFYVKTKILSLATNTNGCLLWSDRFTLFSRKCLPNTAVGVMTVYQSFYKIKIVFYLKSSKFSLQLK